MASTLLSAPTALMHLCSALHDRGILDLANSAVPSLDVKVCPVRQSRHSPRAAALLSSRSVVPVDALRGGRCGSGQHWVRSRRFAHVVLQLWCSHSTSEQGAGSKEQEAGRGLNLPALDVQPEVRADPSEEQHQEERREHRHHDRSRARASAVQGRERGAV
eukprot:3705542-Rhodomonas_salina.1